MRLRSLAAAAAMMVLNTATTSAVDIANNLSETRNGGVTIDASVPSVAQGFTTSAAGYIINNISVMLKQDNAASPDGTINFSIYTADGTGGAPNTLVSSISTVATTALPTSNASSYTLNSLNVTLSPNTTYYLVLTSTSTLGNGAAWGYTNSTNGTGFPSNQSIYSSSAWSAPSTSFPQLMQISAVPEPSTYALAVLSIGTLAFARNQRRKA